MGGTLRHPGNIFNNSNSDGTAEWNVFADPQAAAVVWDSKVPVTLVPLDATNKVRQITVPCTKRVKA
jgi:purine nucleosidase